MSFTATISGHIDQAIGDAEAIERQIVARLEEVVREFDTHISSAWFSGSHTGGVDVKSTASAPATDTSTAVSAEAPAETASPTAAADATVSAPAADAGPEASSSAPTA